MLFGKSLRDHLPQSNRRMRSEWEAIADSREEGLARRVSVASKPHPGKELPSLQIGDSVSVQNQTGNRPNKWNNTGIISVVLPFRQYHVVMDGSRRVSLRNRRFLLKISPVCRREGTIDDLPEYPTSDTLSPAIPTNLTPPETTPPTTEERMPTVERCSAPPDQTPPPPASVQNSPVPPAVPPVIRRGTRERIPVVPFVARMDGKHHN